MSFCIFKLAQLTKNARHIQLHSKKDILPTHIQLHLKKDKFPTHILSPLEHVKLSYVFT